MIANILKILDPTQIKDMFFAFGQYILGPTLIGATVYMIMWIKKKIKEGRRKKFYIKINAEKATKIQNVLSELLARTNSNRAHLNMFHNGDAYIDGSAVIRISRISEVCSPGISHESGNYQGILISIIPQMIDPIINSKVPVKIDVDLMQDCRAKNMLMSQGVQHIYCMAIFKNKAITGLVGLDFIENEENSNILSICAYYSKRLEEILAT